MSIAGVLLAAGRGVRMGRTKQLLPWPSGNGGSTVVAAAFDSIAGSCDHMVVVLGHDADAVVLALAPRRFTPIRVSPGAPMFESIRAGLGPAVAAKDATAVLLHLADHPTPSTFTVQALLAFHVLDPQRVALPEYRGKGGHPVLIPCGFVPEILRFSGIGGLRAYWEVLGDRVRRLVVDDPGAVRDLDTPDQYGP